MKPRAHADDPSAHVIGSGRSEDARTHDLQRTFNQAEKIAPMDANDPQAHAKRAALVRALLGAQHMKGSHHGR